ncbi:MAG: anoctamin, partial [archaeon]|nr:anoctamin [archaeon]
SEEDDPKKTDGLSERWGLGLFTECEMLSIEKSILDNIPVPNEEKFKKLLDEVKDSLKIKDKDYELLDKDSLFNTLLNLGIIKDHFALNVSNFTSKIIRKTFFSFKCPKGLIRAYYGDKVAIYFYWLYYYSKYLLFPSFFSLLFFGLKRMYPQYDSQMSAANSLFIAFWAHLFGIFWTRRTKCLMIEWDNFDGYFQDEDLRKEYKGNTVQNKITGKLEKVYPKWRKYIFYFISIMFTLSILAILLGLNLAFLNLNGFIKEDKGIFYIPQLGKEAKEGGRLDSKSKYKPFLSIIQAITIAIFNLISDKIAIFTTYLENHKHKTSYENSIVIKRFLFTFMNTFFSPYYLAFILVDYNATSNFLKSILYSSEIKRVLTSTIFPIILKSVLAKAKMFSVGKGGDRDRLIATNNVDEKEIERQKGLNTFDFFNEYLEIMIEFCYLTIFSRYLPLTGVLIILINFVEIRSDMLKLGTIYKRGLPERAMDIGSWQMIFSFIAWMSVFVNLLSSYNFYEPGDYKQKYERLFNFCSWEHILIIISALVRVFWPVVPGWVDLFLKRRDYRKSLKMPV